MKTQLLILCTLLLSAGTAMGQTYNDLWIPDTLSGTRFNLELKDTLKQFRTGPKTITGGINHDFWGPTLMMNKGDTVRMIVRNKLNDSSTVHWHGMHLPAVMDGGPHQIIPPGTLWSPYWKVMQKAATLWYHPHLHEMAQKQVTLGLGGFIYIRDAEERSLNLPRAYGVDDIPMAIGSRKFSGNNQFLTANAAYGDYVIVNGTENAKVSLPKQYVRLRLLNSDIARGYNVGFSDNRNFYVIATDGGLVNAPIQTNRVILMIGERAEILVDLSNDAVGATLDLKAYNSGQNQLSFPGAENQTQGQFGSLLNNRDFNLVRINVSAQTANPVLTVPTTLTNNIYWTAVNATVNRTVRVTGGQPPGGLFTLDNRAYGFNRIDQTVNLDATEKWTITNNQVFGHAFHIHDIEFKIISRTSGLKTYENGWKDVVYIPRNESVSFVAKFDDFADSDPDHPYMYHCHLTNHEDEGMMGQFLVTTTTTIPRELADSDNYFELSPNPVSERLNVTFPDPSNTPYYLILRAVNGRAIMMSPKPILTNGLDVSGLPAGVYILQIRDTKNRSWTTKRFVKQ